MNFQDYLSNYKEKTLAEAPFNEIDALIFAYASYFSYDDLGVDTKKFSGRDVLKHLENYIPTDIRQRKLKDIEVLRTICSCKRFENIKFYKFEKVKSEIIEEQFQAITIILKNMVFISFCGTDASLVGWKEDFNMAIQGIVPSEIEAISYINEIRKKFMFRDMYIGGHSKGGRLALRAAKGLVKKNTLRGIYSFDGPNFEDDFYDKEYRRIVPILHEYAPDESIVGRLINDRGNKIIVASTAHHVHQHDGYSWCVEDNHFVYRGEYTKLSNKIVKAANEKLNGLDDKTKQIFIDTVYDILLRKEITDFRSNPLTLKGLGSIVIDAMKEIPKEQRKVLRGAIIEILSLLVFNRE